MNYELNMFGKFVKQNLLLMIYNKISVFLYNNKLIKTIQRHPNWHALFGFSVYKYKLALMWCDEI
jgi:hypothetical protein